MSLLTVILVSGKRYAGKDYTADLLAVHLERTTGQRIVRGSFAEQLKRAYAEIHSLSYERLMTDASYKELHRPGLIKLATDERAINPGVWVERLLKPWTGQLTYPTIMIVSDCRFLNEYETCQKFTDRVFPIRVNANDSVRIDRGWRHSAKVDDDPSECQLDSFEHWRFVIQNNGQATYNQELIELWG